MTLVYEDYLWSRGILPILNKTLLPQRRFSSGFREPQYCWRLVFLFDNTIQLVQRDSENSHGEERYKRLISFRLNCICVLVVVAAVTLAVTVLHLVLHVM